jgi:hypothetical protein
MLQSILTGLPAMCLYVDQGAAALVTDLKQRGLLDTTFVHWGGEMGRPPAPRTAKPSASIRQNSATSATARK